MVLFSGVVFKVLVLRLVVVYWVDLVSVTFMGSVIVRVKFSIYIVLE